MTSSPTERPPWRRVALAFLAALSFAAAWGSLVQTQFNIHALTALGVAIPFDIRWAVSMQDLIGFGPLYAGIVLAAWLPGFLVAHLLARRMPSGRTALYALAAGVGVIVAIRSVDAVAPMPALIDATRGLPGLMSMASGSVLGGVIFARLTRGDSRTGQHPGD